MDKIIKANPLNDYRIDILTSSGISGIFDVKPYLQGSAFKELTDESYFVLSVPPTMALCGHTNKILVPILLFGFTKCSNNKALQRTSEPRR